jgi:hypothetical protein
MPATAALVTARAMNLFSFVTEPIDNLWDAFVRPFKALFVVALCYFVNRFTSPENPWWHWVAFGMAITVLFAWARAFKTIVFLLVIFYVGRWIYRTYGDAAKARFDEWVSASDAAVGASETGRKREAKEVLRLVDDDAAVREAGIVQ